MLLALDISTSIVGISLFSGSILKHWDFIEFNKGEDLFDKIDFFEKKFDEKIKSYENEINSFAVEEAAKKFSNGMSTAHTINLLISFNILVCNFLRKKFKVKPIYVNVTSARSKIGLKFPKGTKSKDKKIIIADYVENKYSILFPRTRTGSLKAHAYDVSDSVVIGEYALLNGS